MDRPSDSLFAPLTFRCGVTVENRVALAPLTNGQSNDDGTLDRDELVWLCSRARGGFGLVSTCAAFVSHEGKGFAGQLGVATDAHDEGLATLARSLDIEATVAVVQLYHGGARCPSALTGVRPWSAVSASEDPATHPDAARRGATHEIEKAVEDFVRAAERSKRAGFAGVEVHGAHGYLLCQFLSRHNTRDDGWGGALEGRARIVREIVRGVRARCGSDFLVGVRLSPEDFGFAVGMDLDESVTIAQWCAEDGADFVHLSLWDHSKPCQKRPDEDLIALFRRSLPSDIRILTAGKIWTPAEARSVLARGADMVALGRSAILNPAWPMDARTNDWTPARGPMSASELAAMDISPRFVEYLKKFKNIVREG